MPPIAVGVLNLDSEPNVFYINFDIGEFVVSILKVTTHTAW